MTYGCNDRFSNITHMHTSKKPTRRQQILREIRRWDWHKPAEEVEDLADRILALDAVTQSDECPLRGKGRPREDLYWEGLAWWCKFQDRWCIPIQGKPGKLPDCEIQKHSAQWRESYHASRCRECQRPEPMGRSPQCPDCGGGAYGSRMELMLTSDEWYCPHCKKMWSISLFEKCKAPETKGPEDGCWYCRTKDTQLIIMKASDDWHCPFCNKLFPMNLFKTSQQLYENKPGPSL